MMKYSVSEFAKITGVSVRTLHYYDQIDLLKPDCVDPHSGYRFYGERELERMQAILFYRELDFSLKAIGEIISSADYDNRKALDDRKRLLNLKIERLKWMVKVIERTQKGESIMDFEAFSSKQLDDYKDEVKKRWGDTEVYRQSQEKSASYTEVELSGLASGLNSILAGFAELMKEGLDPSDERAAEQVRALQGFITETQYNCTDEILLSLGELYVADNRFKRNIDKNGVGSAEYICNAIKACIKVREA